MAAQARLAHIAVAVEHRVARAHRDVVVCRPDDWDMVLPQVRRIKDRERDLAVDEVHVDDVRSHRLAKGLKLPLGLRGIQKRCGLADLPHRRRRPVVVLRRDEVPRLVARLILGVFHGEEEHLVPLGPERIGHGEVVRLRPTLAVVELVDENDPHPAAPS